MNFEPLFEKLNEMGAQFLQLLPLFAIAVVILIITAVISNLAIKLVRKALLRTNLRSSLISLSVTVAKIVVWIIGILIVMSVVFPSVTPAKLIGALGLGTIAIGFAFQDFFKNLLAGIMIMLRKPMRIGDYIQCEGFEGRVEEINMRESYVRQTDGQLVLVPNGILFDNPVYVLTDHDTRRYEIIVGVSYEADLDNAKSVIQDAVAALDLVEKNRKVDVFAREFADSSINFTVRWWAKSKPLDLHESRDEVVRAIKRALDKAEIEIPFPQRVVAFKDGLRIEAQEQEDGE